MRSRKEADSDRVQPWSTHLFFVGERFEENSALSDLSPISVETANNEDDLYTNAVPTDNKYTGKMIKVRH